jgi:F-type H+-transporting ATPase subunit delta
MTEPSSKPSQQRVDVSAQRIAKVYALALLDAAQKAGQVREVLEEFGSLVTDVFNADPRLEVLLSSAAVGRTVRQQSLEKALKGRAHPILYNFLQVVNHHERLELLRPILAAARAIDDERNRRLRVTVSTAIPLDQEFKDRIAGGVRNFFHLEPVLLERVDAALLGGLKVQIGDMVYDGTVRTRIDNLKQQILARSSHEIQSRRDSFSS